VVQKKGLSRVNPAQAGVHDCLKMMNPHLVHGGQPAMGRRAEDPFVKEPLDCNFSPPTII
jgi:hypothetical protein